MLESIEKLRKLIDDYPKTVCLLKSLKQAVDEIEAEVDRLYMALPPDADGVPIRMGDTVISGYETQAEAWEVSRMTAYDDGSWDIGREGHCPFSIRHVKPKTLRNVLYDFMIDCERSKLCNSDLVDKYEVEIWELLGGDAE